jgi:hypothetical protein
MKLALVVVAGALLAASPAQAFVQDVDRIELQLDANAQAPARAARLGTFQLHAGDWVSDGAGQGAPTNLLALVLAIFPSFGLGHYVYGDMAMFTMFLVIQLACVAADILFRLILWTIPLAWLLWGVADLVFAVAWGWQVYDMLVKQNIIPALRGGGGDTPAPRIDDGIGDVAAAPARLQPVYAALAFDF